LELHKGYFPHHFNTPENQNKIFDSYPRIEYYGDKFMSVKDRNDFLNWHSKQNGLFNCNVTDVHHIAKYFEIFQRKIILALILF
jgi:hypothetical protein